MRFSCRLNSLYNRVWNLINLVEGDFKQDSAEPFRIHFRFGLLLVGLGCPETSLVRDGQATTEFRKTRHGP